MYMQQGQGIVIITSTAHFIIPNPQSASKPSDGSNELCIFIPVGLSLNIWTPKVYCPPGPVAQLGGGAKTILPRKILKFKVTTHPNFKFLVKVLANENHPERNISQSHSRGCWTTHCDATLLNITSNRLGYYSVGVATGDTNIATCLKFERGYICPLCPSLATHLLGEYYLNILSKYIYYF